jgi:hypothetical protein
MICVLACAASPGFADDDARKAELLSKFSPYFHPPAEFADQYGDYKSPLETATGDRVTSATDWQARRAELDNEWRRRLGGWPPLVERPAIERLESVDRGDHLEQRVRVQIAAGDYFVDGYLLIPRGEGPFPAVLVPFYEPLTSISRGDSGQGTHDYGLQLAKRGIVTLSIGGVSLDSLMEGEEGDRPRQPLSLMAYAAANCHTALAQMQEVLPDRIGIVGLSFGGKWSMFASCLYDKFACAVWSDPGIVFNEENANVNYWEPWYLGYDPRQERAPGVPSESNPRTGLYKQLVEQGEDLVSLHALMAPRPLLVSGGTEDPFQNWRALNHLIAINMVLGQSNRVAMTAREGHIPTPEALAIELAFLEYWLKFGLDGR